MDLLRGADVRPVEVHRLFFALLPDAATRGQFVGVTAALKANHSSLRARWVKPTRYHATLYFLGDYPMLRPEIAAAAKDAADIVRGAPFAWMNDCVSNES